MATVSFKQKNPRALRNIARRYKQTTEVLKVGYPKELVGGVTYPSARNTTSSGTTNSGAPLRVTDVAFANEFGSMSQHIPPRPFMRKSTPPTEILLKKENKKLAKALNAKGTSDQVLRKFLRLVGPKVVSVFQNTITNLREPPNAPATIAFKKSDNPLIDTGLMRQTLTSIVVKKKKGQTG